MATTRVVMPQLGESVHEGTISRWLVKPGDRVTEFEPLLEVETDKVSTEVPSPVTGVLKEVLAPEGETVRAGAEIAVVEVEAELAEQDSGRAPAKTAAETVAAEPARAPLPTPAEPPAEPSPSEPSASLGPALSSPAAPAHPTSPTQGAEHRYSPGVLLLAQEHGVDLSQIKGTGLGGRVTKRDVRQHIEAMRAGVTQAPGPAPTPAAPAAAGAAAEGDRVVPLTRTRKLIAENMTRSKTTIPHAWQTQEVDMSGVVANRQANRAAFQQREGFSLTYLPYVIAAAASALREHPQVNATFGTEEILIHRQVNIGVSVAFEDTLLVPVIRDADSLSVAGLARAVHDLASRARAKQLKADELQGGTFTVNNSGTFGTLLSYSVINPGQAGILTMEAVVERPVAVSGMIAVKPMMYLCFSFDHRVLDGLQAARFLTSCRRWLEAVTPDTPIY